MEENLKKITILYASQTGQSFKYATLLSQKLKINHDIMCFNDFELLSTPQFLIFVVSTYFDGKPPSNGNLLYEQINDLFNDFRVERSFLKNIEFCVFGLGNKAYGSDFCLVARNICFWLRELGARRVFKPVFADEYCNLTENFEYWSNKTIQFLEEYVNDFFEQKKNLEIYELENLDENILNPKHGKSKLHSKGLNRIADLACKCFNNEIKEQKFTSSNKEITDSDLILLENSVHDYSKCQNARCCSKENGFCKEPRIISNKNTDGVLGLFKKQILDESTENMDFFDVNSSRVSGIDNPLVDQNSIILQKMTINQKLDNNAEIENDQYKISNVSTHKHFVSETSISAVYKPNQQQEEIQKICTRESAQLYTNKKEGTEKNISNFEDKTSCTKSQIQEIVVDEESVESVPKKVKSKSFSTIKNYQHSDDDSETDFLSDIEDIGKKMLTPLLSKNLKKQGYSLVKSHSAVKLCRWTKSMLRGHGGCYKHTFYGISSLSCMEVTPSLACANKCVFCWRHYTNPVSKSWKWEADDPNEIFEGFIAGHNSFIKQLRNSPGVTTEAFELAQTVRHCALSLVGEPIMYPHINELLFIFHTNKISTFLVTNAQFPSEMEKMRPATQLYLSIDAGNKMSLREIDRPLHSDFWERLIKCVDLVRTRKERTVFRLTVVKDKNMHDYDGYRELIKRGNPSFVEVKGVTFCGYKNKDEMSMKNVPFHHEVVEFCENILVEGYEIACVHEHSCCVLIAQSRFKVNGVWHTWIDYKKFFEIFENEDFDALDYSIETPQWGLYGSKEKGFDPNHTRRYRNKQTNKA